MLRVGEIMDDTDKRYNGQLIEEYQRLKRIRKTAVKENAVETVKDIDEEIQFLKLKLQPLELPNEN